MAHDKGKSRFNGLRLAAIVCICVGSGGCAGFLKQPPVAKGYFAIDPGQPEAASIAKATTSRPDPQVLRVRTLRLSPPYDGVAFVYRTGPSQFDTDYYNNFVAPPASLLTGALVQWLARAGPMTVCDTASDLRANLTLEGNITSLYIDSTTTPPRAVVAGRFFLTRDRNGDAQLLFEKAYDAAVPVPARSPAGFVDAWSKAYRQILAELSADLRNVTSIDKTPQISQGRTAE